MVIKLYQAIIGNGDCLFFWEKRESAKPTLSLRGGTTKQSAIALLTLKPTLSLRGGTTKQSAQFQQSANCLKNDCESLADCFTRCARSQ